MVPFWIWLSKITINEAMDKLSCVKYCSEQKSHMITVGHLEYASEFEVFKSTMCKAQLSGLARKFPERQYKYSVLSQ